MAQPKGSVYAALNRSVDLAVEDGKISRTEHGALIAAARKVARVMDEPGWPIICGGKFDNVSPATLLKYCQTLGITPDVEQPSAKEVKSKLQVLKGDLRGKTPANKQWQPHNKVANG